LVKPTETFLVMDAMIGIECCQARTGRAQRNHICLSVFAWLEMNKRRISEKITLYQQTWEVIKTAIQHNIRWLCLLLVSDVDQLPSVGAGQVLKDIINSSIITTVRVNQIFRQSESSAIITNAHKVNMVLVANPRKITLRAMEIITKTKEIVILNPSQYFIPTAQNISNIPAIKR